MTRQTNRCRPLHRIAVVRCACGHHRSEHYRAGCDHGWARLSGGCPCRTYRRRFHLGWVR